MPLEAMESNGRYCFSYIIHISVKVDRIEFDEHDKIKMFIGFAHPDDLKRERRGVT